jgi:hypothetical protein
MRVQPSVQLINFGLDNLVPLTVVGGVLVLPKLVFLDKSFAVRERFVVVSNDFS